MCVFCLNVCLCIVCMPGSFGGQKRVFYSLEPELQTIVSHWVGAENLTWALCKSSHWTSLQPWYKPHYLYVCFESFSKSSCLLRLQGTAVSKKLVVVSITDITVSSLPCDAFSDQEVSESWTPGSERSRLVLSFACIDISGLLFWDGLELRCGFMYICTRYKLPIIIYFNYFIRLLGNYF